MLNDSLNVLRGPAKARSFSMPFWQATRDKKLLLQYDPEAQKYQFPPRATSIHTGRRALEWREVSGAAEVYSYTILHHATPAFAANTPFAIVLATLDEQVNVMANLVNCTREALHIGLRLKPCWAALPDGHHLLMFEPA
jgi:uncharacterized OB-fold protein